MNPRHASRRLPVLSTLIIPAVTCTLAAPVAQAQEDCPCDAVHTEGTIELVGIVRDLRESSSTAGHADFEVDIDHGPGQYSGNVDIFAGAHGPVFIGDGNRIDAPATDSSGNPIAPHLANRRYSTGATQPPTAVEAILTDSQGVDAYRITFVSAVFNTDGTSTWTYHVEELPGGKDLSHWLVILDPSHQIAPGTTAGYTLGIDGSTGFYGIKWDVTESFNEGTFEIVLTDQYVGADTTCSVVAKGGNQADIDDLFAPTADPSPTDSPYPAGGGLVSDPSFNDTPPTLGPGSNGGITSTWSFRDWYQDNPPANMSTVRTITLQKQGECTFVFDAAMDPYYSTLGGFFPVDGELLGNSGGSPDHNFHFTYEVHATVTYDASGDGYLRFTGDDDVWVFIDGKLAIDLGGIHGPLDQWITLDRMGLTDGQTYEVDMYFAERHRTQSNFRIETNLCLEPVAPTIVSAIFD